MAGIADSTRSWQPIVNFINNLKEINHPHELSLVEKAGYVYSTLNQNEIIHIVSKMLKIFKKKP